MNFLEKLDLLMGQNNLNKHSLSEKCGIPYTTIDAFYKKGFANAKLSTIQKLANFFDTTLDYLMREEITDPEYGKTSDMVLTNAQRGVITRYIMLDSHGQEAVNATLNVEFKRWEDEQRKKEERLKAQEAAKKKNANKIVEMPETKTWVLPSYDISASAGTGTIFDESECTPMVLKSEPPYGAAFVIPITGDSMIPKFHDGDYVFVRPQPMVEIGQIGIFYHDGGSYIKQLGDGELVSLNPEYPNIKIDEYTHCFGRVLGVYKPDSDAENEDDYEYYRIARSTTKPGETEKLTKNVLDNLEQKTKNGDFKRDYKF